jgi:hypothetical protein
MPHESASPVRDLVARLASLRGRIRRVAGATALARWTVGALVALGLFFLADLWLDLPLGVRRFVRLGLLDRPEGLDLPLWAFLFLGAAALAVAAARRGHPFAPLFAFLSAGVGGVLVWSAHRAFRPLGARWEDRELALSVERKFRHLNDRLAAALDFEREVSAPRRGESVAMMRSVMEEASREAAGLEFDRVVSTRRARRWTGAAAAALGLAALVAVVMPQTVELWARRSLLAQDLAWPRATTLIAVVLGPGGEAIWKDPAEPYGVSVGRSLTVHAMAQGTVPDEVSLVDLGEGAATDPGASSEEGRRGRGEALRRRMSAVADRPGVFAVEIRDIRRPFAFALEGGDDRDLQPRYRVEAVVPPQVLDLAARLEYPGYLGRAPEVVAGGALSVPEGTRVEVSFRPDGPVASARAFLGDEVLEAAEVAGGGGRRSFSFTPASSTRYRIELRARDGRENDPARDTYEVRVDPDRAPRVEWIYPRAPFETTPEGRVPLLARALDDHAVAALALEVRLATGEVRSFPLAERAEGAASEDGVEGPDAAPPGSAAFRAVDGPYGRATVRAYLPLELRELLDASGKPPAAPARLSARFVARDSKGQSKEGAWTPIDVYRGADLERTIASRRSSVRSEVQALLLEQQERRRALAEILAGPLGDAERDHLRTLQFAQAKIAQDAERVVGGLLDLFADHAFGRLAAPGPNERILAIYDLHHRTTYGEAPADPAAASPPPGTPRRGDPAFPYEVYDRIVAAWRDRTLFDSGVLDRMLGVVAHGVESAARLAPAAHGAAAAAAAGGAAEMRAALAAEDALVTSLEQVLEAMRGWQNLNDVVTLLRRIVEEQESLNERLNDLATGADAGPR